MKKFTSIKDVKLNDMKKKELIEANGGFSTKFPTEIITMGMLPPDPSWPDPLDDFRLPKPGWPF